MGREIAACVAIVAGAWVLLGLTVWAMVRWPVLVVLPVAGAIVWWVQERRLHRDR